MRSSSRQQPEDSSSLHEKNDAQTESPGPARAEGTPSVLPARLEDLLAQPGTDASSALIQAAAFLFNERGPNRVSLRSIAERAGVNYGLIHRHFGSKEELLSQIVQMYTTYGREFIPDDGDALAATELLFRADSGRFAQIFTSAILDGTPPRKVFADTSSQEAYNDAIRRHWETEPHFSPAEPLDHRVVAAVSMLVILLWDLFAPYLQTLGAFEDRDRDEVRDEVVEILKLLISTTAPYGAEDN